MIRKTTGCVSEEVTGNRVDCGWGLICVIEDIIPCVGDAMVVEGIAQRRDRERGTLCLGKVFLVVRCQVSIHGVDIVNAGPGGVGVFGVTTVVGNFQIIHIAVRRWVYVSVETLEHGTFCFGLDDAFNDRGNVLFSRISAVEVSLSKEFMTMVNDLIYNFSEGAFGFP